MISYAIGIMRDAGRPRRYLRLKSDEPLAVTDAVIAFTKQQPDKTAVYECIVGDMLRETRTDKFFYRWYALESVLIETDHTPPVKETLAEVVPAASAAPIVFVTLAESGQIDDVTAGEHAELFSHWEPGVKYEVGNLRQYSGQLYRCVQAHTSQADWTPDVAASQWAKAADPAEEWPEWSQPIGAHDAYNAGDKVSHNGKHWTSEVSANVWEPGVYGWTPET